MSPAEVIALFGPTGVGKTEVAIALAGRLRERGERPVAVSADALQVYAGLERLTGVAGSSERAALEHRLISFLPADATFSVGQYAELAHSEIDGLLAAGERPIVVGGTGLYLRAAISELSLRPPPPKGSGSTGRPSSACAGRQRCTPCSPSARPGPRPRSSPATGSASSARSSCSTPASSSGRAEARSCGRTRSAIRRF